jgi:hypothetical protein
MATLPSPIFQNNMIRRLGCFTLIIALGLLALFYLSDLSHTPDLNYLVAGLFLGLIGIWLYNKGKPEPQKSTRFRLFRRPPNKEEEE